MPDMDTNPIEDTEEIDEIETCATCGVNVDECDCITCPGCDRMYEASTTEFCNGCDQCDRCCSCFSCSRCGARVEQVCANCERCDDHCDCRTCQNCDLIVSPGSWHSECDNCNECCNCDSEPESSIQHFTNPLKFHTGKPSKLNPSKRYVAVEIEVASISQNGRAIETVCQNWQASIVGDGSLPEDGFEINTAPASGDAYTRQINNICYALEYCGAKVTTECGLHVHIDARDYTYYDLRRLVLLYEKIEHALFRLCAPSRHGNRYCKPCGAAFAGHIRASRIPKESKKNVYRAIYKRGPSVELNHKNGRTREKYDDSRYSALNIHSWFYRGTIECRMHHGTVSAKGIKHWGILWARLLDYALQTTEKAIAALPSDSMLALLEVTKNMADTHAWVISRTLYFAKRDGGLFVNGSKLSIEQLQNMRLNAFTNNMEDN